VKTLLVIDIGTSSTKVSLFSVKGKLLYDHQQAYRNIYSKAGWAEQDPSIWWQAACQCSARVIKEAGNPTIAAVSVSGQTPSCVPVDEYGEALRPAILWLDRRADQQVSWLHQNLGLEKAVARTGNTIDSYYGGVKWLWFKQEEPELYKRTWKILQASSYIIYHLTSHVVLDYSQAGLCSPCFDLYQQEWDLDILKLMEIDLAKLPILRPAIQVVGMVSDQAARMSSIPAGTPVTTGAGDFAFSCLGAGVLGTGTAVMMLGTAGNLLVPDPAAIDPRLINTIHVTGEKLSLGGVIAGAALTWFKDMLNWKGEDFYLCMETEADETSPGADELVFLPYLMGERTPIWDDKARGIFFGLSNIHQRGHLYRAILEGIAYAFRAMLDIVTESGTTIQNIVLTDGGAQSKLWRQIFVDILGRPIQWQARSGGTALGAAITAAIACGELSGFDSMMRWFTPAININPDPKNVAVYDRNFQVFQSLYPKVKDLYKWSGSD
jgi:xylulokinase